MKLFSGSSFIIVFEINQCSSLGLSFELSFLYKINDYFCHFPANVAGMRFDKVPFYELFRRTSPNTKGKKHRIEIFTLSLGDWSRMGFRASGLFLTKRGINREWVFTGNDTVGINYFRYWSIFSYWKLSFFFVPALDGKCNEILPGLGVQLRDIVRPWNTFPDFFQDR